MSLHPLPSSVGNRFTKDGLLSAREKSWASFQQIRSLIQVGVTETEAKDLCLQVFKTLGVTKHWHKPQVRLGPGTTLNFNHPSNADYRLREGDPVYLDLGPVWTDPQTQVEYEGDVGDTFVIGKNEDAEKCAETARILFKEAQVEWSQHRLSGAHLYAFLKERAVKNGYVLVGNVDGHRISDFPHIKYSKERLANLAETPEGALWVLEIHLVHPALKIGAFFEDILGT